MRRWPAFVVAHCGHDVHMPFVVRGGKAELVASPKASVHKRATVLGGFRHPLVSVGAGGRLGLWSHLWISYGASPVKALLTAVVSGQQIFTRRALCLRVCLGAGALWPRALRA